MTEGMALAEALTVEHRAIDDGIEAFLGDEGDPQALRDAMLALRRHIYLEEVFLFPPLKPTMMMPIFVMLREHGELWRAMDGVDAAVTAGEDADAACRDLLVLLDEHNKKEEPIVYPRADADLDDEVRAELADFLRDGTYPEGWVCEQA
ncbi:hemerythrin domain-containing protein [Microbacterium suwonense]|uniref:Hemerythrin n=1 Tax=Microbacterium suwonense TaxID=683047 RepID=A0ABN6X2Q4_9MICO|nr:hemerythrin domain-containing protein [Microbacterium suwonense]BDZ38992.1 hemerythrin [Microbacterium suwonense]